ncbi:MAG: GIY-YIG nuclease family protein [Fibrobacter sp.]|nr:GIY-YIG nuclease family protein [Fibrobacter sp.]
MLRCAGNRIYTGYAVDVEARFKQHVSGKGARFTKAFPPECVLRQFELETKGQALRLEARIKKLSRPQKELLASGLGGAADGVAQGAAAELLEKLLAGLDKTLKKPRKKKVDPIASLQGDAKD